MNTRRGFIALLGAAVAGSPSARAQQALPTIGFLSSTAAHTSQGLRVVPFLKGLKEERFISPSISSNSAAKTYVACS